MPSKLGRRYSGLRRNEAVNKYYNFSNSKSQYVMKGTLLSMPSVFLSTLHHDEHPEVPEAHSTRSEQSRADFERVSTTQLHHCISSSD